MSEPRETMLYILIALLLATSCLEAGWIIAKQEDLDRDGKIAKHETRIKMLESELKSMKERIKR